MSSNRYQIVKKSRKFQMNPESSGEQVVSSMKVQTFGSTRTGGADNFAMQFPAKVPQPRAKER